MTSKFIAAAVALVAFTSIAQADTGVCVIAKKQFKEATSIADLGSKEVETLIEKGQTDDVKFYMAMVDEKAKMISFSADVLLMAGCSLDDDFSYEVLSWRELINKQRWPAEYDKYRN